MAEIVGGKLDIHSKPNEGTRVTMSFPSHRDPTTPLALEQRRYA
jgi:signal transduction histidine kinase